MARLKAMNGPPAALALQQLTAFATFDTASRPGGGMADAEDLKSSGDFSSWGFDSPPGHHASSRAQNELSRGYESIASTTSTTTITIATIKIHQPSVVIAARSLRSHSGAAGRAVDEHRALAHFVR